MGRLSCAPREGDGSVLASCTPLQKALSCFDWLFLPKIKAVYRETGGANLQDVVQARLLVVLVIYLITGLIFFLTSSSGTSATAWGLRAVVYVLYTAAGLSVRFLKTARYSSIAMMIFLIASQWILVWYGAGAATLTTGIITFFSLVFFLLGGWQWAIVGFVQSIVYIVVVWQLDQQDIYEFPVRIKDSEQANYQGGRALYIAFFSSIMTMLFMTVQNSRVGQLKALNQELQRAVREAQEAADLKTTFIATMSHEIRTPLNGIIGMAQVLSHSNLDQTQKSELAMLQTCGESLLCIVNDILDIAKITANKVQLERTSLRIQEVVQRACSMLSIRAHEGRVQITHDLLGIFAAPEYVGDPVRISQVLMNILTNAVKFTSAHGEISVKAWAELGTPTSGQFSTAPGEKLVYHRIVFEITDTGLGIPADRLEAIFEPFTQNDASTTRQHGGTGLGLTISRSLARLMGGDVKVASVVGRGSTFTFDFYVQVSQAATPKSASLMLPVSVPLGRHVLLLDDCTTNQLVVQRYLTHMGCNVVAANDSKTAQELLEKKRSMFDSIIVNVSTYRYVQDNAKQAFVMLEDERQRKSRGSLRLIVLRNQWMDDMDVQRMRKLQNVVCLNKPVEFDALQAAMTGQMRPGVPDTPRTDSPSGPRVAHASLNLREVHIFHNNFDSMHDMLPMLSMKASTSDSGSYSMYTTSDSEEDSPAPNNRRYATVVPAKSPLETSTESLVGARTLEATVPDAIAATKGGALLRPVATGTPTSDTLPMIVPPTPSPQSSPVSGVRCLLVEDNPTNVQVATRLLKLLKTTCDVANNGLEGVQMVEKKLNTGDAEQYYNVILMDLHMPIMGGMESAEKIREMLKQKGLTRSHIFIAAVTADASQATRDSCLAGPFDEFMAKPFLLPKLKAALQQGAQTAAAAVAATPSGHSLAPPAQVASSTNVRSDSGISESGHGLGLSGPNMNLKLTAIRDLAGTPNSDTLPMAAPVSGSTTTVSTAPTALSPALDNGSPAPQAGSPSGSPAQALRCLLVEDNPTNVQVVTRLLKVLKTTCDVANNGQEAVAKVEKVLSTGDRDQYYNVILMDLHMPIMGGGEAAIKIREMLESKGLPRSLMFIVASTADALQTTREACLNGPFDEFMAKPFLLPKLKSVLEEGMKASASASTTAPAASS